MHEVLVNRLGGLSLPRKSVVRLTDRPDMTLDVYRGHKTTMQQQQQKIKVKGQKLGKVTNFTYLRGVVSDDGLNPDALSCIAQSTAALASSCMER